MEEEDKLYQAVTEFRKPAQGKVKETKDEIWQNIRPVPPKNHLFKYGVPLAAGLAVVFTFVLMQTSYQEPSAKMVELKAGSAKQPLSSIRAAVFATSQSFSGSLKESSREIELRVNQGVIDLHFSEKLNKPFVILAGALSIQVTGTTLSVAVNEGKGSVYVYKGEVLVKNLAGQVKVAAGAGHSNGRTIKIPSKQQRRLARFFIADSGTPAKDRHRASTKLTKVGDYVRRPAFIVLTNGESYIGMLTPLEGGRYQLTAEREKKIISLAEIQLIRSVRKSEERLAPSFFR